MLIEHVTMQGSVHETRREIGPDTTTIVDTLSARERRHLDHAYRVAAKRRDRRTVRGVRQ